MKLSQSDISKLEDARTVGGDPSVSLSDAEMVNLLKLVARDLDLEIPDELTCEKCDETLDSGFFEAEIDSLGCSKLESTFSLNELLKRSLGEYAEDNPNIFTYYSLLVQLHSYRRKFAKVCDVQEIPELETVIPRGLLEIGKFDEESLVSWLTWRKFLYDIDNRSAQTAGYLFEPILTEAIGGASYSSSKSPIERTNRRGSRQVDCIVGDTAYEFKMRVTIAASGQGRFREELQFAEDARNSGYTPVLLVLDPTPSKKLTKLSNEFGEYGGQAYTGDEAWNHLEVRAGDTLSEFLEKYVRDPISSIDEHKEQFESLAIDHDDEDGSVMVTVGETEIQLR
ncbi:restriction endonuclease [Halosimplex rubrum]|uniref:Restriction endonuclease n=1 Tax=Halosimplex rubrum TaxID=869889 RepID=A0A7D5P6Q4_9EURY|nr:restriction endonuclease [Halosimplex rubrum]QLH79864.1 restriction endonuclease [Halosimplex rubrum]